LSRAIPLGMANMSVVLITLTGMIMLGHDEINNMVSDSLDIPLYLVVFMMCEGIVFGFWV